MKIDQPEVLRGEVEALDQDPVLTLNIGEERQWIVRADGDGHAQIEETAHRMCLYARYDGSPHIAGGADLQRDVTLAQALHQRGILHSPDAVGDAPRAEHVDRLPHALGP